MGGWGKLGKVGKVGEGWGRVKEIYSLFSPIMRDVGSPPHEIYCTNVREIK